MPVHSKGGFAKWGLPSNDYKHLPAVLQQFSLKNSSLDP
jgi:hypothetical protein